MRAFPTTKHVEVFLVAKKKTYNDAKTIRYLFSVCLRSLNLFQLYVGVVSCFRAELIAYYEELSAEATKREQRALWRIKRHQLDEKRRESWELMKHDPLEGVTDLHSTFQVQVLKLVFTLVDMYG